MKYYAVKAGRTPGIYTTWAECLEQIYKYSGAVYKGFGTQEEAEDFLLQAKAEPINPNLPFAYIDGSYSKKNMLYGYGGFINTGGRVYVVQGTGNNPEYLPDRNIAGEALGALKIMYRAQNLNIPEIVLYFDYAGVEEWARGSWKAKSPLAIYYKQYADLMTNFVTVHYVKVKGHTGIEGNELADLLAKEAVGAKLRKKDAQALAEFRAEVVRHS